MPRCPAGSRRWGWRQIFWLTTLAVASRATVAKSVPEQQLNLVEVDVAAVVDLCSRFLPGMVERGRGAVLNVSSLAGFYPVPGQAAYCAAKAFVLAYTESLRIELRGTGVTASALCPGPVATGLDDVAGFSEGNAPQCYLALCGSPPRRLRGQRSTAWPPTKAVLFPVGPIGSPQRSAGLRRTSD